MTNFVALTAVVSVLVFQIYSFANHICPLYISLPLLAFSMLYIIYKIRVGQLIFGPAIYFTVFLLPFIHLFTYIGLDFSSYYPELWGLMSVPYNLDLPIVQLTSNLASIATLSLLIPLFVVRPPSKPSTNPPHSHNSTLPLVPWIIFLAAALVLSYISSPTNNIISAVYSSSTSISSAINFDSSWLFSYTIFSFLILDAFYDPNLITRRTKLICSSTAILFTITFFQFLAGDRESIPWILGLFYLYYIKLQPYAASVFTFARAVKRSFLLYTFLSSFLLAIVVSFLRSRLFYYTDFEQLNSAIASEFLESPQIFLTNLLKGTWTSVLMTPFSTVGDYYHSTFIFNHGQDYINIYNSLLPGFLSDFFGFDRPIAGSLDPALDMTYGGGGTHLIVIPFRAFGPIFVAFSTIIFSASTLIAFSILSRKNSIYSDAFTLMLIAIGPHFIWYGIKPFINSLIYLGILSTLYKFFSISYLTTRTYLPDTPRSHRS